MIDIQTNGLLSSPIPLNFAGDYCSHRCAYCFANINNPARKLDIEKTASIIRNHKKGNDLASFFLREKYPVIISNQIDPFSKSNQPFVNNLVFQLQDIGVPVAFATRGGIGWDKIIHEITPSVFYVTINYSDDNIRMLYEPYAPDIESRFEMMHEILKAGHKVILSLSPTNLAFSTDYIGIIRKAAAMGVKSVVFNKLHLSPKQQANMTDNDKKIIGQDLLKEARERKMSDDFLILSLEIAKVCAELELNIMGFDMFLRQNNFHEFRELYPKTLPVIDDFFNWCADNKEDYDFITFAEFYDFFAARLPDIQGNISKYIFNRGVIDDKTYYKKLSIKDLLFLYWQDPKVNIGLAKHYPFFSWVKERTENKIDFKTDEFNNRLLLFHGENYFSDEILLAEKP